MAKGSQAKIDVGNQIINLFGENAFWNGEGQLSCLLEQAVQACSRALQANPEG